MSDGVPAVLQILFADAMGTASGGSNSGLQDINKNWTPGQWQDAAIDITIGGIRYRRRVIASGINSLTFEPLPAGVAVSAGDFYFLSNPLAIYKSVMEEVLSRVTEASVDTGIADGTSTVDFLDDSAKSWPVYAFVNLIIEITAGTGAGQIRKIAANTATRIAVATPFTLAPDSTSQYRIGFYGRMASDITHWGGAVLSGRDISLDLAKLDIALSALRDAICAPAPDARSLNDLYTALTNCDAESYFGVTTDAYVDVLDWGVDGLKGKTIIIANTGVSNGLLYKVLVKATWDGHPYEHVTETVLAAGAVDRHILNDAYGRITVQVKSAVAENSTNYEIDCIGNLV